MALLVTPIWAGGHSVGAPVTNVLGIINPVTFFGKRIYMVPEISTKQGGNPLTFGGRPKTGFYIDVPPTGLVGFVDMLPVPGQDSFLREHIVPPQISCSVANNATIDYNGHAIWQDTDGILVPSSNIRQFTHNSINSSQILANTVASVYNSQRTLRWYIITTNANVYEDEGYAEVLHESRWYEKGLANGAPEIDMASAKFFRNSIQVTNVSTFENTDLELTIDTNGNTLDTGNFIAFMYREDSLGDNSKLEFEGRLSYNYLSFASNTTVTTFQAFTNASAQWTLVSGNLYTTTLTIDRNYLEQNGAYRIGVIYYDSIGSPTRSNSWITLVRVIADAAPSAPGKAAFSGLIYDANTSNECWTSAAPLQRLKACVTIDKGAWNLAAQAAGYIAEDGVGTDLFPENFKGVAMNILEAGVSLYATSTFNNNDLVTITDSVSQTGDHTVCLEFRVREAWRLKSLSIEFLYIFRLKYNTGEYQNVFLVFPFTLDIADWDTTLVTGLAVTDQNGDPILGQHCDDQGSILVKFDDQGAAYRYSAVLYPENLSNPQAFEETNYEPLNYIEHDIAGVFVEDIGGGQLAVNIAPEALPRGVAYCLGIIQDNTGLTCYVMQIETSITLVSPDLPPAQSDCKVSWALSLIGGGAPPLVITEAEVTVTMFDTGSPEVTVYTSTSPQEVTVQYLADPGTDVATRVDYKFTTDTGCKYEYTALFSFTNSGGPGGIEDTGQTDPIN